MAVKPILDYAHHEAELRQTSAPVTVFNRRLKQLAEDLKETLLAHPGVGLAAPQIGVHQRVIAFRLGQREDDSGELSPPIVLVNPTIVQAEEPIRGYDGCLSIPKLYGYTNRPKRLEVHGQDERGRPVQMTLTDLDARVVDHEVDHLDGKLFIDYIQDYDRDLFVIVEDKNGQSKLVSYNSFVDAFLKK
jgi:peptide deformylase